MAHGKETPRQKMIGMMYLVLTALLALNVSKSVLDSFVLVDNSLTTTTENFNYQNKRIVEEFEKAAVSNPIKVKKWKDRADEVTNESEKLFNFINDLKIQIVHKADGEKAIAIENKKVAGLSVNKVNAGKIDNKDNANIPSEIMVGSNGIGQATKLKDKIVKYRETLLGFTESKDIGIKDLLKKNLDTSDPKVEEGDKETWETYHFEHLPLIAVTTILSKMQSDVRNAESDMLRYLFSKIDAGAIKFNKLEATVIPNTTYVLKGNEYKAQVFIAATDTIEKPEVRIGQYKRIKDADGKDDYVMVGSYETVNNEEGGKKVYKTTCNTVGLKKWGGIIVLKTSDGVTINRPFDVEYEVAETNLVVSPTKMNVLYVGVDNPISISIPGVPADKITATMSSGIIRKNPQGNGWIANLSTVGNNKTNIIVSAELEKGKSKVMGISEFRVKTIPDPVPKIAGRKGGSMDRNLLMAQMVINADLENFDFDAQFRVIEFTVSATVRGFTRDETTKSNRITDAQKEIIRGANKGDRIYFTDIKAVGPDGKPRDLSTLYFKIQ